MTGTDIEFRISFINGLLNQQQGFFFHLSADGKDQIFVMGPFANNVPPAYHAIYPMLCRSGGMSKEGLLEFVSLVIYATGQEIFVRDPIGPMPDPTEFDRVVVLPEINWKDTIYAIQKKNPDYIKTRLSHGWYERYKYIITQVCGIEYNVRMDDLGVTLDNEEVVKCQQVILSLYAEQIKT